jgi:uncharacterized repeat protein (TIGR02543 family)
MLRSIFIFCGLVIIFSGCRNVWMEEILQPKFITFESNGGSRIESQIVYRNEKISEPQAPSMANHDFKGWYTDNISFTAKWEFKDIPKKDMTLYAKWLNINSNNPQEPQEPFKSIEELEAYLKSLKPSDTPYDITIDTDNLTDIANVIKKYPDIFINLTLTSSNITGIDVNAFYDCINLTEITIPDSVTFIGEFAFLNCGNITKVTFKSNIPWGNFRDFSFPGDLMNKYYEADPNNGTPGTYTRPNSASQTWTRQ